MIPRVEPDGVIRLIDTRTQRPFCVVQNGCIVIQVGHGADKHYCSVAIAELVRLSDLLASGAVRGVVESANTMQLGGNL